MGESMGTLFRGSSTQWQDLATVTESLSAMRQAMGHMAHRYRVLTQYHVRSFLSANTIGSKLRKAKDTELASIEGPLPSNGEEVSSNDLFTSASSFLHRAKDEASHLMRRAYWDWDRDSSGCSSADRWLGSCKEVEAKAVAKAEPVDFWHACAEDNVCLIDTAGSECDPLCGLFQFQSLQSLHSKDEKSTQARISDSLSQASRDVQKHVAAGITLGSVQLLTAWDTIKRIAAQGVQIRFPAVQQPPLLSYLREGRHSAADHMRSLVQGTQVDWSSVDVCLLLCFVVGCCVAVTLCMREGRLFSSGSPATQAEPQVRLFQCAGCANLAAVGAYACFYASTFRMCRHKKLSTTIH
jgi:hypothetical protein